MTRSPHTSTRITPAGVWKVTPLESLRDSLTANCGSSFAQADEPATSNSTWIPQLINGLIGVFILNPYPSFPVNSHRLDFLPRSGFGPKPTVASTWVVTLFVNFNPDRVAANPVSWPLAIGLPRKRRNRVCG